MAGAQQDLPRRLPSLHCNLNILNAGHSCSPPVCRFPGVACHHALVWLHVLGGSGDIHVCLSADPRQGKRASTFKTLEKLKTPNL